jgi:dipeptidyl aminopeptidase/acylaminoacyl peptidase
MRRCACGVSATLVFALGSAEVVLAVELPPLQIPKVATGVQRPVTLDDIFSLRTVGSIRLSPDRTRFAIFVSQADAQRNEYRTRWFVGRAAGGPLTDAGDGGLLRPNTTATGFAGGEISGVECRWSPDGHWIAYPKRADGEVQLWVSAADGSSVKQLTRHDADVIEMEWSADGHSLYFTAGTPRAELQAREERKRREGYRYDEDIYAFTNLMQSEPTHPAETEVSTWKLILANRVVSKASATEKVVSSPKFVGQFRLG